jgi:nucleoside-diphosphate-sugar epimerase
MILVTGGLGVMGTTLVKGLLEKGNAVRVLDIPNHPHKDRLDGTGAEVIFGDITRPETYQGAFDGVDTIFHLAAILLSNDPTRFETINVGGTRNMVEAGLECGAKHFISVSSISVTYPYTTAYSLSKRSCEAIVKGQDQMHWTIIRPSLAYNAYGGEEFMMFLDYLKKFPVVPFIGSGNALKNPVHVDDLMRGFLAVANNPKAYGKIYNFCGSEEITIRELGKLMLRHQGISKPMVSIPVPICKLIAAITAKTMRRPPLSWNAIAGITQNANPDWSEAKKDLDYNPIGVHEGLQRSFPLPE